jgi:hypothetical protein
MKKAELEDHVRELNKKIEKIELQLNESSISESKLKTTVEQLSSKLKSDIENLKANEKKKLQALENDLTNKIQ